MPQINEMDAPPWEEPLPLGWRTDLAPFPIDAIPGVFGQYARALSTAMQTPPDLAGSVILGVVAGCIGGRVRVRPRAGWTEPTNLWTVPVLPPGARKSPVVEACASPLLDAEEIIQGKIADERRNATIEHEARQKMAKARLDQAAKDCDVEKLRDAQQVAKEADEIRIPTWPQLTIDDSTPESLVSVLAEQGGRVAAISAEAGIFDALTGRYSKKANLDAVLKAHAGDTIRVTRQLREPQLVRRPALTLIASIQPFALQEMVSRPDFAGRGMLARVLWALPIDNVGHRTVGAPPVPDDLTEEYRKVVTELAVSMAEHEGGIVLTLTEQAAAVHLAYEQRIEVMLRPDGAMGTPLMRGWGSKLAGATLRIAASLHAMLYTFDRPISVTTMKHAVRLAEFYRAHAAAALYPGDDTETSNAQTLLRWLCKRDKPTFQARDIQRGAAKNLRDRDALDPILRRLVDLGWIRRVVDGDKLDAYALHPETGKLLDQGDTCDTCDSEDEIAGQAHDGDPSDLSQGHATECDGMDVLSHVVASSGDGTGADEIGAYQGELEPVARVARVALVTTPEQTTAKTARLSSLAAIDLSSRSATVVCVGCGATPTGQDADGNPRCGRCMPLDDNVEEWSA